MMLHPDMLKPKRHEWLGNFALGLMLCGAMLGLGYALAQAAQPQPGTCSVGMGGPADG